MTNLDRGLEDELTAAAHTAVTADGHPDIRETSLIVAPELNAA